MRNIFSEKEMIESFWNKVHKTSKCWIWVGAIDNHGYGKFRYKGRALGSHRISYIINVGNIPDNMQVDHTCHNKSKKCKGGDTCLHRRCVNPKHLEPVTQNTNLLRGKGTMAINARKICCNKGHELNVSNTYIYPNGKRKCITCRNTYRRTYWLEKHDNRILKA